MRNGVFIIFRLFLAIFNPLFFQCNYSATNAECNLPLKTRGMFRKSHWLFALIFYILSHIK